MGCGRTNTKANEQQQVYSVKNKSKNEDYKIKYQDNLKSFDKFVEKNPQIISQIDSLPYSQKELMKFLKFFEQEISNDKRLGEVLITGIVRRKNEIFMKSMIRKDNLFDLLIEQVDKIKQTDTDIKYIKEILSSKNFHTTLNSTYFNLDLTSKQINELKPDGYFISSLIESVMYEVNDNLVHSNMVMPLNNSNYLFDGKIYLSLANLIEKSVNLISFSLLMYNQGKNYEKVSLNTLQPVLSSVRSNASIKNIAFLCYNCKGVMDEDIQNDFLFLLTDPIYSFAYSGLDFNPEITDQFIDTINDLKTLKLMLYEPPEDYSFDTKKNLINKITDELENNENIELIYLTGFEDCTDQTKTIAVNRFRKKGVIKNLIIADCLSTSIQRYLDF